MEKETNEKIMAISEYSDTVMENMNKTHNEIMFLYNMLNDKHTELTGLATDLQKIAANVKSIQEGMAKKKAALACSVCGSRNYTKSVSEGKSGERLEINKFCKYCNQYTLHKETK